MNEEQRSMREKEATHTTGPIQPVYTNQVGVWPSNMDLQLVFAVEGPTTEGPQVVAALVMTMPLVKGLYERLGMAITQYEERCGPIVLPEIDDGPTNSD